ncbi:polysaccharide deacetylase family protein [Humibacillus xanthopallidus]|uniref:Peptidoglycan/xylan/chitin deacetylase (PgdA/CDA1 family) n=1 Tax=Humibacillus xanthopallidus TaxID=412689 RepID=A0A543HG42_9MICO|nr:polysaccharide deacetylase family protein [Humibacillus xanthopallidus]TQM57302.1 peptidoglycan/xylan/chitin deacetylase (PgdA/CDA1 family) [Humibacillus xanthopallidus]
MDRRLFLTSVAALVATGLSACSSDATAGTAKAADTRPFKAPQGITKVPLPHGTLYRLPGKTNHVALTVDDGTNPAVIEGYAKLCRDTGLRVTFFCNGVNRGWTEHAGLLRPLHDDNQVFLANHTWSHPNLVKLSSRKISDQVHRNETFLKNTYGTLGRPFMRPPYGFTNARVKAQLADLGYPAVTMWLGSLGDSSSIPPAEIVANAEEWMTAGRIVIGHANHRGVLKAYGQLVEIIRSRALVPVHLGDVYAV